MYSKVKVLGHPLHPMLIAFPVAFYTATFVCYLAYAFGADAFWFHVGVLSNVAGVVSALVAAIPGFLDWALGIPTGSPAKKRGLLHMGLNVAALVLYGATALSVWEDRLSSQPDVRGALLLTGLGFLCTVVAGYHGWTLVQKYHVGVELTREQQRLEPTEESQVADALRRPTRTRF